MSAKKVLQKQYFDQAYIDQKSKLHLFLQVDKKNLHACYLAPTENQFVGLESYSIGDHQEWGTTLEPLRSILNHLDRNHKKVSLTVCSPYFVQVPSALFSEEAAMDFFEYNHKRPIAKSDLLTHAIEGASIQLAFEFPFLIKNLFQSRFNLGQIIHESAPFLEYTANRKQAAKETVYLEVHQNHFQIGIYKDGKLHLYNQFKYATVEDFMYFFLYTLEQLELDRETLELKLSGMVEKDSPIYRMLFTYIRKLELISRPKVIQESQVLSQLGESHFFNLFNQYLCES